MRAKLADRECAERLGITVKTLENHLSHIFDKVSVASRHELTALAYEKGVLDIDQAPSSQN